MSLRKVMQINMHVCLCVWLHILPAPPCQGAPLSFLLCALALEVTSFGVRQADPAPALEASHSLEERLQQLRSSAPDSEALVREISGHWKKHLECLEKTEPSEDGAAAAPASEASESTSPVSLMTPNSTPAPEAPASPQQNHQDQTEVQREEEEEGAHVSLVDRLSEAEEKIKVLHSSLNTAQTELLDLRCKYNQEMAN
ncbi:hypothetical protein ATANTOWER_007435, partial [Ataeniobius toweri]|nr:hypothetical protein [Ataeniobius toweri]